MLLYWANVLKEVSVRYLIASDIHGSLPAAEALLARFHEEGADRLLLLGDVLYHGPRNPLPAGYAPAEVAQLLNRYADRITAVRGNCDAEVDQMVLDFLCRGDYALVVDEGTTLFLTHGHLDVRQTVESLPAGSIIFSGHTHVKGIGGAFAPVPLEGAEFAHLTFANPGSTGHPKDGSASYALYEHDTVELKML